MITKVGTKPDQEVKKVAQEITGKRNKEFSRESLIPALEELEKMFDDLKPTFAIPLDSTVLITIAPMGKGRACYGIFTHEMWKDTKTGKLISEITITAETLGRPWIEIYATVFHEMGHAYGWVAYPPKYNKDNQRVAVDCSREGTYHNRIFADIVQPRGLICLDPKEAGNVGWGSTTISPEKEAEVLARMTPNDEAFRLVRIQLDKPEKAPAKPKRIKYICGCIDCKNPLAPEGLDAMCKKCGEDFTPEIK